MIPGIILSMIWLHMGANISTFLLSSDGKTRLHIPVVNQANEEDKNNRKKVFLTARWRIIENSLSMLWKMVIQSLLRNLPVYPGELTKVSKTMSICDTGGNINSRARMGRVRAAYLLCFVADCL